MRKQTKIAAIVSATALLAVGASMTSFAATGWQEENGTWVYYDKDGEYVTNSWQKSGDNYFYLDDDGLMAVDSLITDDTSSSGTNYYYVDSNGAMVTNQWIAIDNPDYGEEGESEVIWYYFQANGKAYKRASNATTIQLKTINGKKYTFNESAEMLYGWVDSTGEIDQNQDTAYQRCEYYFGGENDGAMTVGWIELDITDDSATTGSDQPGDYYWEEEQTRWFYFKSSGKKQGRTNGVTINGRKYGFDDDGRMIASWYASTTDPSLATAGQFMYFSTPEDGARYNKGWFKVVPGYYLSKSDYEDGSSNWYYANGDGTICADQVKKINGKWYAFGSDGAMLSGFQVLTLDNDNRIINDVETHLDSEGKAKLIVNDSDKMKKDTEANYLNNIDLITQNAYTDISAYYFSGDADADGSRKSGTYTITINDADYTFNFGSDGKAVTGIKSNKIYYGGMLLRADSDEKFAVVVAKQVGTTDKYTYTKVSISDFIKKTADKFGKTGANTYEVTGTGTTTSPYIASVALKSTSEDGTKTYDNQGYRFYLINASGSIVTGTKKNGDETYKITSKKVEGSYTLTIEGITE